MGFEIICGFEEMVDGMDLGVGLLCVRTWGYLER